MKVCRKCGVAQPEEKFELLKTGTRRCVCNRCRWIYYVRPCRMRRILRELDDRKGRSRSTVRSGGRIRRRSR